MYFISLYLLNNIQAFNTILILLKKFFFDVDRFFKVFIEFVTILLLLYVVWFFGYKACGILAPQPGTEHAPPALEGEVLTTGPPGKSLILSLF